MSGYDIVLFVPAVEQKKREGDPITSSGPTFEDVCAGMGLEDPEGFLHDLQHILDDVYRANGERYDEAIGDDRTLHGLSIWRHSWWRIEERSIWAPPGCHRCASGEFPYDHHSGGTGDQGLPWRVRPFVQARGLRPGVRVDHETTECSKKQVSTVVSVRPRPDRSRRACRTVGSSRVVHRSLRRSVGRPPRNVGRSP